MGIRPTISLICGVDNLKVDEDGNTIDSRMISDAYLREKIYKKIDLDQIKNSSRRDFSTVRHMFCDVNNAKRIQSSGRFWVSTYMEEKPYPYYELLVRSHFVPNVVGFRINELNDHDIFRVMCDFHPEYSIDGYKLLKNIPLKDDRTEDGTYLKIIQGLKKDKGTIHFRDEYKKQGEQEYFDFKRMVRRANRKKHLIKNHQNTKWELYHRSWSLAAYYFFKQLGCDFKQKDFKLMLFWEWS